MFDGVYAPLKVGFPCSVVFWLPHACYRLGFAARNDYFAHICRVPPKKNAITMKINKLSIKIFPVVVILFRKPILIYNHVLSDNIGLQKVWDGPAF
jgi:hypothetical protein